MTELELVARIRRLAALGLPKSPRVKLGIGDDCAIYQPRLDSGHTAQCAYIRTCRNRHEWQCSVAPVVPQRGTRQSSETCR